MKHNHFPFFFLILLTKNYHFYSNKFQIEKMQSGHISKDIITKSLHSFLKPWSFFFLICITKLLLTMLFFPRIN